MDIRAQIIEQISMELSGRVSNDITTMIQDILVVELNKYDVTERCTDLVVVDNSSEIMLKKFVVTKCVEGLSENTIRRYVDENRKLINFLNKPLNEIATFDIRFYLANRRKDGISNRTLDGMRRCYSSFFGWLYREGLIDKNPCLGLAQIKYKKQVKKPFTSVELEKIKMCCKNKRDLALVSFLYSTGCRVSEVSKLNTSDVNFDTQECIVIGKGNKERTVYLSDVAIMHLQEYLDERKDLSEALFVGKGTERLGKTGIEALLKRIEKEIDVEDIHPHRFRRTLATNLLDRGMNIQDVAEILGHSDLKTTQIYCYISKDNVKTSYKKYAV